MPKKKNVAKKESQKKKPKKPQKPKKISTKNLGDDQKEFIEKKVTELASIEAVKKFYDKEDAVSQYAMDVAKKRKLPDSKPTQEGEEGEK